MAVPVLPLHKAVLHKYGFPIWVMADAGKVRCQVLYFVSRRVIAKRVAAWVVAAWVVLDTSILDITGSVVLRAETANLDYPTSAEVEAFQVELDIEAVQLAEAIERLVSSASVPSDSFQVEIRAPSF